MDKEAAAAGLEEMLREERGDKERAEILYHLHKFTGDRAKEEEAMGLFKALWEKSGKVEYRERIINQF